jgi:hypothetical protein
VLYESILAAKPGSDLAFAIRDGVPYEKLKDELVAQVATVVVYNARGVAKLEEEAKAATEQSKPETPAEAPVEAPAAAPPTKKK